MGDRRNSTLITASLSLGLAALLSPACSSGDDATSTENPLVAHGGAGGTEQGVGEAMGGSPNNQVSSQGGMPSQNITGGQGTAGSPSPTLEAMGGQGATGMAAGSSAGQGNQAPGASGGSASTDVMGDPEGMTGGAGGSSATDGMGEMNGTGDMGGAGGMGAEEGVGGDAAGGETAGGKGGTPAEEETSGGFEVPTGENSIAYIGCSMAWNIGNGYKRVGGNVMWTSDNYQTSAMVVQNWTDPNSASWNLFDQKMNQVGGKDVVKAIMVQICIFSSRATDDELLSMISSARQHVNPDAHIFMVGQPVYNAGHDCSLAGAGGADWTDEQAERLGNDPSVDDNISYLGQFILDNNAGEVSGDSCHASSSGEDALGRQAMEYFGG